jgi:hypothetical protein
MRSRMASIAAGNGVGDDGNTKGGSGSLSLAGDVMRCAPETLAEGVVGARGSLPGGGVRDAKRPGGLFERDVGEPVEQNDVALIVRQRSNRVAEAGIGPRVPSPRTRHLVHRLERRRVVRHVATTRWTTQEIDRHVPRDGEQPGREPGAVGESIAALVQLHEGRLRDIGGVRGPDQGRDEAGDPRCVPAKQLVKGEDVTGAVGVHQGFIARVRRRRPNHDARIGEAPGEEKCWRRWHRQRGSRVSRGPRSVREDDDAAREGAALGDQRSIAAEGEETSGASRHGTKTRPGGPSGSTAV